MIPSSDSRNKEGCDCRPRLNWRSMSTSNSTGFTKKEGHPLPTLKYSSFYMLFKTKKKKADIQHTDLMFSMHLPSDKHTNAFCWAFSPLTFLNRNINAQKKKEPSAVGNDTKYKPWVKSLCFSGLPLNKWLQKFQNTFPMQLPEQLIVSQFHLIFFWEWHTTLTPELLQTCGKDPTQAMLLLATTIKNLTSGEQATEAYCHWCSEQKGGAEGSLQDRD